MILASALRRIAFERAWSVTTREIVTAPIIVNAAKRIRTDSVTNNETYALSLCVLFLDRLGNAVDEPLIDSLTARIMGGGSAQLNPHHTSAPVEALAAVFGGNAVRVEEGCTNNRLRTLLRSPIEVSYFARRDFSGPAEIETANEAEFFWVAPPVTDIDPLKMSVRLRAEFTPEFSGDHEFGLVSAGRSRLFLDRKPLVDAWTNWKPGRPTASNDR